ncbi:hypothetical protein A3842_04045 [Paenibacillus sp. P3E]|uniref:hypothetical protein n=1 Tax=Paenibacillus sp. P3E TaxID=1349435 RepID=UPI00093CAE43|nr:hypothetical protein [Paenibacillus sp. P3E]OKP89665.1 hypothetical protein A3842_04045 [Paenibacillus sp. P3E]
MKTREITTFILMWCIFIVVGIAAIFVVKFNNFEFLNQFKSFAVTIDNQSENDIISVETGVLVSNSAGDIVESDSKDTFDKIIKSGEETRIRPNLQLSGEGGIYLKYTDSRKETFKKTICSYTESLSGYSKVIITNDNVTVDEKCN